TFTATTPGFDPVNSGSPTPLAVTPAPDAGGTPATAMTITADHLYSGTISSSSDLANDKVAGPAAGSTVAVYLDHLTPDADLVMYGSSAAVPTLRDAPLGKHPLGKHPVGDDAGCLPEGYVIQPQTLQDVPVSGDAGLAVRSFST